MSLSTEPVTVSPQLPGALLDLTVDGVVLQDSTGRIVRCNPAAAQILGVADDELAGRNWIDPRWRFVRADGTSWPGDTHPAMIALHTGRAVIDETMGVHRPDGALVWLRVDAYPVESSADGRQVATFLRDLTDAQHRVAAHDAAERRFRTAFSRSPVAHLVIDAGGRFVDANPALATLLGRPVDELVGFDVHDLVARDISPALAQLLTAPGGHGMPATTVALRRANGDERLGVVQRCEIEWVDGAPCTMVIIVDVTDADRSHRALARSDETWRRMFASSPVGMALLRADGTVVDSNPAMSALLGRTADELVGAVPADTVHPDELASVLRFAQALPEGGATALEHRVVRPDGEIRWLRTHLVRLDGDDTAAFLAQSIDQTIERRREDHLQLLDEVTGALSREGMEAALQEHLFAGRLDADGDAFVVVELGGMDDATERLGNIGAGHLLRRVAATVRASLPTDADVARTGPETFVALCRGLDDRHARRSAERLLRLVAEAVGDDVWAPDRTDVRVTILPVERMDRAPAELLAVVEQAVREVGHGDRGPIAVLRAGDTPALGAPTAPGAPAWSDAVAAALRDDHFTAVAEPLVGVREHDGTTRHELLVRLVMPGGTLLAPWRFERYAHRLGLAGRIDRWMVDRAVDLLRRHPTLELEVNLAPATIADPRFVDDVAERVRSGGVQPSRLLLAVNERTVLDDVARAFDFAGRVLGTGVRLVLDDVGTGASVTYAAALRCSRVKVHGRLIRACAEGATDRALVGSLVAAAHDHGLEVAAPFVNAPELLTTMRVLGVDLAQGRLVGHPVPVDDLVETWSSPPSWS